METRADMLFDAELSVRYHRRRASFLELTSAMMSLIVLVAGAGAFVSLLGEGTMVARVATLIVTIIATVQVVFRIDASAAQQRIWLRHWLSLLTDIRTTAEPSPEMLTDWVRRKYELEGECVQELRALVNDCFNRTMRSLDLNGEPVRLRWWHRAFIQVWPFEHAFEQDAKPTAAPEGA